jgi:hypothetical protein
MLLSLLAETVQLFGGSPVTAQASNPVHYLWELAPLFVQAADSLLRRNFLPRPRQIIRSL